MSVERNAKNVSYRNFYLSDSDDYKNIVSSLLVIPEFQRNYVWKKGQIEDLMESILDNDIGYYIGSILTVASPNGTGISNRDAVIDGQQRFITLSLLVRVILNKLEKSSDLYKEGEKIIIFNENIPRIKLQKEKEQIIFKKIILGEGVSTKDQKEPIYKSYKIIEKFVESKVSKPVDFFEKIKSLEIVVMKCGNEEGAYQLFEGLNSTGLNLTPVELTKNAILGFVKKEDKKSLKECQEKWEQVEDLFIENDIAWFRSFLRQQWFYFDGYINHPQLFRKIKEKRINNIETTKTYIDNIVFDSDIYIKFRTGGFVKKDFDFSMSGDDWNFTVQPIFRNISVLGFEQIYSVLMALYKQGRNDKRYFKNDTFVKHIKGIWGFLFIIKFSKISPASYERKFANLCKDIGDLDYQVFKKKMGIFFMELDDLLKSVDAVSFSKEASEKLKYKDKTTGVINYLLKDYLLICGGGLDEKPTIEHIIPRNNLDNWFNISDTDKVKKSVELMGNLTLLNETLNRSIEDKSFDNKNTEGYKESVFIKNKNLKKEWGESFKSKDPSVAVKDRGKLLFIELFKKYKKDVEALF